MTRPLKKKTPLSSLERQLEALLKAPCGIDQDGNVKSLPAVEAELIRYALNRHEGQISKVARQLGIGRTTLYRKIKEHGIDVAAFAKK